MDRHGEKQHLFDNPRNVKRLLRGFYSVCLLLIGLDLVVHRHVAHGWESLAGFYAIFGFVAFVVIVYLGRFLRLFVKRDEDYYDS